MCISVKANFKFLNKKVTETKAPLSDTWPISYIREAFSIDRPLASFHPNLLTCSPALTLSPL